MSTQADLIRLNTNDMIESFGLEKVRTGRRVLEIGCYWPARSFARTVLEFDRRIGCDGLQSAAGWGLRQFSVQLAVVGGQHIPKQGPTLFLSNHPGITDTLALFSALPRPDLQTVAAARPFLEALPNMSQRLIYVPQERGSQSGVVPSITRLLRGGAAILTFPAGRIEPDPAVLPGAAQAMDAWSDSIDLFARLVPEMQLVPVLVSGIYAPASLDNPLTRLRHEQKERERFAAMLQIVAPWLFPVRVTVRVGAPLLAKEVTAIDDATAAKRAVITAMRAMLPVQEIEHG